MGRPRSFDREAALREAMLVFWRHGYETSSIADLTTAMGITPPSLYAAFGSKRQLFLDAVRLYAGDPADAAAAIASAPTAREAASQLLTGSAAGFTGDDTPAGCLLASATASGSAASADVQEAVADFRRTIVAALRDRVETDVANGSLPSDVDTMALAEFTMTVIQGLSVMARDGTPRGRLLSVVERALASWPACGN